MPQKHFETTLSFIFLFFFIFVTLNLRYYIPYMQGSLYLTNYFFPKMEINRRFCLLHMFTIEVTLLTLILQIQSTGFIYACMYVMCKR